MEGGGGCFALWVLDGAPPFSSPFLRTCSSAVRGCRFGEILIRFGTRHYGPAKSVEAILSLRPLPLPRCRDFRSFLAIVDDSDRALWDTSVRYNLDEDPRQMEHHASKDAMNSRYSASAIGGKDGKVCVCVWCVCAFVCVRSSHPSNPQYSSFNYLLRRVACLFFTSSSSSFSSSSSSSLSSPRVLFFYFFIS